ncbi:MAG: cupredoxin domain-containing protein [Deltaproteobacteria bacterium]|nr:cupredoxin domain-containing protein [Deltaproteobacteria bacterium]MBW2373991.1 cupredoxin domain-containing protein [Deltaproteobacteria bacterium]
MRVRMLVLALLLAAAPASAGNFMVHVGHDKLNPAQVKIKAGDTVVFHNMDQMPGGHTVVSEDGELQSPPLALDGKWSHTFVMPGKYQFHIKEHPGAKATVIVE